MKAKKWLTIWIAFVFSVLIINVGLVYVIDPFFHYHKPLLSDLYYVLDNERSQNDGIVKHFDYNALITGTSMTENFRTSELDKLFDVRSIKVPFSGGSYKEINDNVERALGGNSIDIIVRGLDLGYFLADADLMREDLGMTPVYLYDDNLFNDIQYIMNRDIVFGRVYPMIADRMENGVSPGITSFDDYSRWQDRYDFGINAVCPNGVSVGEEDNSIVVNDNSLSDNEKKIIHKNIDQNVTGIADKYPETQFYYFFTPYSVVYWKSSIIDLGQLQRQIEIERYTIELILQHSNIHLFSFGNRSDIIADLNNYKDSTHYASWINSLILKWMHDGEYQLTKENYESYLEEEYDFLSNFDYNSLNQQEDYEADLYAAALLNKELTGADPEDIYLDACVNDNEYVIDLSKGHRYLCFYGKGVTTLNKPVITIRDETGDLIEQFEIEDDKLDNKAHQFAIDLSKEHGMVTVFFKGGNVTQEETEGSDYNFFGVKVY